MLYEKLKFYKSHFKALLKVCLASYRSSFLSLLLPLTNQKKTHNYTFEIKVAIDVIANNLYFRRNILEKLTEQDLTEQERNKLMELAKQEKLVGPEMLGMFTGARLLKNKVDESMLICKKLLEDFPLSARAISRFSNAPSNLAEYMLRCIPSREVAYSFVLDELWAMDQGNARAKKFIALSGIPKREWGNAVEHSLENELWSILRLNLLNQLWYDFLDGDNDSGEALGVASMIVIEKIMQKYSIGIYKQESSKPSFLEMINNFLK